MKDPPGCRRILLMQFGDENGEGSFGANRSGSSALWGDCASLATSVVPDNLTEWVSAPELARIVAGAVKSAERPAVRAEFAAQWELLLAWTTFAYVTGRFSSDEIAGGLEAAGTSPAALCLANASVIRQFRRLNRVVLEDTVTNVIRSAHAFREEKLSNGRERPRWEVVVNDPDFRLEASGRLRKAVQLDCWALDD